MWQQLGQDNGATTGFAARDVPLFVPLLARSHAAASLKLSGHPSVARGPSAACWTLAGADNCARRRTPVDTRGFGNKARRKRHLSTRSRSASQFSAWTLYVFCLERIPASFVARCVFAFSGFKPEVPRLSAVLDGEQMVRMFNLHLEELTLHQGLTVNA